MTYSQWQITYVINVHCQLYVFRLSIIVYLNDILQVLVYYFSTTLMRAIIDPIMELPADKGLPRHIK